MRSNGFLDGVGAAAGRPIAFAHRGAAGSGALAGLENTMVAFQRAVSLGYSYLETDVHATADGVAVAFHDRSLRRVTGARGRLDELTWAALAPARVRGEEPIPRLDDLLAAWPDTRINLDAKAPAAVLPLLDAVRRTGTQHRVCVGSFSHRRLSAVRRSAGWPVCTGASPPEVLRFRFGRAAGPPACLQVPVGLGPLALVDESFVERAHGRGLQVHVWTVDDPAQMQRLLDLGVDGLMTDEPEVLRRVLQQRGVWH